MRALLLLAALPALAQSPETRTRQTLDLILARNYQAVYDLFTPEMKAAITLPTYSKQCDQLLALGQPLSIGEPQLRSVENAPYVTIPVHWPSVTLNFSISWTPDHKIQGTNFRPGTSPAAANWQPPDYADPAAFTARDLTLGDDKWKLPATFTYPRATGPFPAVVLVHGSGPNDRDETAGGAKPFKDLAQGLASRGIAVIRYVKRTKQYPVVESATTMTVETVEDAVRAAALLRLQPEVDPARVFILGHSQGGYMMPRILARDPAIAGGIILGGNVRPIQELVLEQYEYLLSLAEGGTEEQKAHLQALKRNPWSFAPTIPATYKKDLEGYNPAIAARDLRQPLLILQGERDYQVPMKDFTLWREALASQPNVTFRSYPKLNHLFIPGEGTPSPAEYNKPGHVALDVIADIAAWITRLPAPKPNAR